MRNIKIAQQTPKQVTWDVITLAGDGGHYPGFPPYGEGGP